MKLASLFSGGKDSTFAAYLAKKQGHEIKYLASIVSSNKESFMYHTANIGLVFMQSRASGIQLVSKQTFGEKEYEVEDLKILLKGLDIEGVVCGAIESEYQKKRVEKVCNELNLKLFAPLWHRDPEEMLKEMVSSGFEIIITSVAAEGLDKSWLGRKIDESVIKDLVELRKKYEIHIAGEGGEFETFVLDCPLFAKKIQITDSEVKWQNNSGELIIKDAKLVDKL